MIPYDLFFVWADEIYFRGNAEKVLLNFGTHCVNILCWGRYEYQIQFSRASVLINAMGYFMDGTHYFLTEKSIATSRWGCV